MKYNKLIAEFMGCTHPHNDITDATLYEVSHGIFELNELRYDMSWDWLMPVIENIDHLQYEPVVSIENALATRSIDDTYKSVVEFIKEYNNED